MKDSRLKYYDSFIYRPIICNILRSCAIRLYMSPSHGYVSDNKEIYWAGAWVKSEIAECEMRDYNKGKMREAHVFMP